MSNYKGLSKLIKEYDRIFSLYIRQKYSENGVCTCSTCGKIGGWRSMDNGHFMPRQHMATRWDERNCAPQCVNCNHFHEGEQFKMLQYLNRLHGVGTAELMSQLSRTKWQSDRFSMQYKIDELKKLMKSKKMILR